MSLMKTSHILNRIQHAQPESPIAVFEADDPGVLNAVFRNAVHTENEIRKNPARYIGSWHGENADLNALKGLFNDHVRSAQ